MPVNTQSKMTELPKITDYISDDDIRDQNC